MKTTLILLNTVLLFACGDGKQPVDEKNEKAVAGEKLNRKNYDDLVFVMSLESNLHKAYAGYLYWIYSPYSSSLPSKQLQEKLINTDLKKDIEVMKGMTLTSKAEQQRLVTGLDDFREINIEAMETLKNMEDYDNPVKVFAVREKQEGEAMLTYSKMVDDLKTIRKELERKIN